MLKFFTTIVFIAEVVLAVIIARKIVMFDRKVNNLSDSVVKKRYLAEAALLNYHSTFDEAKKFVTDKISQFKQRQKKYSFDLTKSVLFYICLIFLKGRYKKIFIAYEVLTDVISGIIAGLKQKI